jgi:hypothetical protein
MKTLRPSVMTTREWYKREQRDPALWEALRAQVRARDGDTCVYCGHRAHKFMQANRRVTRWAGIALERKNPRQVPDHRRLRPRTCNQASLVVQAVPSSTRWVRLTVAVNVAGGACTAWCVRQSGYRAPKTILPPVSRGEVCRGNRPAL